MSDRIYYVICADNCKFESMTKEQILTAITQAVEQGEIHDVDTGFVTRIKEQNAGRKLMFWVGTQAQYNAIAEPAENTMYLITDPQLDADLQAQIDALHDEVNGLKSVDITDKITLTPLNEGISISNKHYAFDPANGIVRFWVAVSVSTTIAASTPINIQHEGGYNPAFLSTPQTVSIDTGHASYIQNPNQNPMLTIRDDTAEIATYAFWVTGWYFCDGA